MWILDKSVSRSSSTACVLFFLNLYLTCSAHHFSGFYWIYTYLYLSYVIVQFSCFLFITDNCQNSTFLTGIKTSCSILLWKDFSMKLFCFKSFFWAINWFILRICVFIKIITFTDWRIKPKRILGLKLPDKYINTNNYDVYIITWCYLHQTVLLTSTLFSFNITCRRWGILNMKTSITVLCSQITFVIIQTWSSFDSLSYTMLCITRNWTLTFRIIRPWTPFT